jgi:hypothetical protein
MPIQDFVENGEIGRLMLFQLFKNLMTFTTHNRRGTGLRFGFGRLLNDDLRQYEIRLFNYLLGNLVAF